MGITAEELDDIIIDLGLALEAAKRARRIALELDQSPEGALSSARVGALAAVRIIARHFPPAARPVTV
jgi:hypothetical protein